MRIKVLCGFSTSLLTANDLFLAISSPDFPRIFNKSAAGLQVLLSRYIFPGPPILLEQRRVSDEQPITSSSLSRAQIFHEFSKRARVRILTHKYLLSRHIFPGQTPSPHFA